MARQRIERSDREWRELLTEEEYRVGVKEGTERAFTPGNLNDEKRPGRRNTSSTPAPAGQASGSLLNPAQWPPRPTSR